MHHHCSSNARIGRNSRNSPEKPRETGRNKLRSRRSLLRPKKPVNSGVLRLLRPICAFVGLKRDKEPATARNHCNGLVPAGRVGDGQNQCAHRRRVP